MSLLKNPSALAYLLRACDSIYGHELQQPGHTLAFEQVKTSLKSPWQNPFVEREMGVIRREGPTAISNPRVR